MLHDLPTADRIEIANALADIASGARDRDALLLRRLPRRRKDQEGTLHGCRASAPALPGSNSPPGRGSDEGGLRMLRVHGHRDVRHLRARLRILLCELKGADAPCGATRSMIPYRTCWVEAMLHLIGPVRSSARSTMTLTTSRWICSRRIREGQVTAEDTATPMCACMFCSGFLVVEEIRANNLENGAATPFSRLPCGSRLQRRFPKTPRSHDHVDKPRSELKSGLETGWCSQKCAAFAGDCLVW